MPNYSSNALDVLGRLKAKLKKVQSPGVSNITRTIATSVRATNIRRIHNNGQDINGREIGQYKEGRYKMLREEKGKKTDKVNLTFTGKLSNELVVDQVTENQFGIGFITSYGGELKEILEEKYDKTIWGTTVQDRKAAKLEAEEQIKRIMNG